MPKKRVLSEFLCREMLFDYILGRLDEREKQAVKETLQEYPNLIDEIRYLNGAIEYCTKLKKIEVTEHLFDEVEVKDGLLRQILFRYRKFPQSIKYGIPIVFLCLTIAVGIRIAFPTLDIIAATRWMTLVRVGPVDKEAARKEIVASDPTVVGRAKEIGSEPDSTTAAERNNLGPTPTNAAKTSAAVVAVVPSPVPTVTVLAKVTPASAAPNVLPLTKVSEPKPTTADRRKGFVFRAYMFSKLIDQNTKEIADKIIALGGAKAGEVDLGWKRKGGRYFHFVIPESHYDEFLSFIKEMGPVRIQKDAHPRVMPVGQVRFILWVEDTKDSPPPSEENTNKTPESPAEDQPTPSAPDANE